MTSRTFRLWTFAILAVAFVILNATLAHSQSLDGLPTGDLTGDLVLVQDRYANAVILLAFDDGDYLDASAEFHTAIIQWLDGPQVEQAITNGNATAAQRDCLRRLFVWAANQMRRVESVEAASDAVVRMIAWGDWNNMAGSRDADVGGAPSTALRQLLLTKLAAYSETVATAAKATIPDDSTPLGDVTIPPEP